MAEEKPFVNEHEEVIESAEKSVKEFRIMWETLFQSGAYDTLMHLGSELRQGKERLDVVTHKQLLSQNGNDVKRYVDDHVLRLRGMIIFPLEHMRKHIQVSFGTALNVYLIKRPLEISDISSSDKITVGDAVVISADPTGTLRIWGERTKVEKDGLAHTEERLPFLPKMFVPSQQHDRTAIKAAILGAHLADPKIKTPQVLK